MDITPKNSENIIDVSLKHAGEWLDFKTVTLKVNEKTIRNYEYIERSAKKKGNKTIDGVSILPIITYSSIKTKKIIIEANFRPPVNSYVLELPGGLTEIDGGVKDAIRELKEETGYIGKESNFQKSHKFPSVYFDPWKSTETGKFIIIDVDGDDEQNKNPLQNLEETEEIIVYLFDLDNNLLKGLEELAEKKKYLINDQLYSFALGLAMFSNFI